MRSALLVVDPLRELFEIVDAVVRPALDLPLKPTPLVKRADLVALACERAAIMAPCDRDWNLPEFADQRWQKIGILGGEDARHLFTKRHNEIAERLRSTETAAAT